MAFAIAAERQGRRLAATFLLLAAACTSAAPDHSSAPPRSASAGDHVEGMFDVGGHRLYMECEGNGSPRVVFLHGVGGQASDWNATLTGLNGIPTCNYDRLNAGRSDLDPRRHRAIDSVRDLEALLDVAGVEPPYVLVPIRSAA
jgi:hypothetical protein